LRLVVARSLHHADDGRARFLRVVSVVQDRHVRRPVDDAVAAVGRERRQLVLQFEPRWRLLAGADDRQRLSAEASKAARLVGALAGVARNSSAVAATCRVEGASASI
jgi:hypothetical protein